MGMNKILCIYFPGGGACIYCKLAALVNIVSAPIWRGAGMIIIIIIIIIENISQPPHSGAGKEHWLDVIVNILSNPPLRGVGIDN